LRIGLSACGTGAEISEWLMLSPREPEQKQQNDHVGRYNVRPSRNEPFAGWFGFESPFIPIHLFNQFLNTFGAGDLLN
jgi:hypothetical protein